ncbi:MAG: hypothetical protein ABI361_07850 [Nitrososphaera sp.]
MQKSVRCKSCGRRFLAPVVDTSRQEISEISEETSFGLICPFCMTHEVYRSSDLE